MLKSLWQQIILADVHWPQTSFQFPQAWIGFAPKQRKDYRRRRKPSRVKESRRKSGSVSAGLRREFFFDLKLQQKLISPYNGWEESAAIKPFKWTLQHRSLLLLHPPTNADLFNSSYERWGSLSFIDEDQYSRWSALDATVLSVWSDAMIRQELHEISPSVQNISWPQSISCRASDIYSCFSRSQTDIRPN